MVVFGVMALSAMASRPFRNIHTNIIAIILNLLLCLICFQINLKVNGFKSTLLVDKYFVWMQVIQSGVLWSCLFVYLLVLCLTKSRWNVNKEFVQDLTGG